MNNAEHVAPWRDVMTRMVAGIEHLAEIARLWEPDHSSGADRRGWLLAQDAKDDAKRLLAQEPERWIIDAAVEIEVLRRDLDTALGMLADWCVAVDENGAGWDDWDEHYKDAMYRDGPLRAQLDKAIAEARSRTAAWKDIPPPPEPTT